MGLGWVLSPYRQCEEKGKVEGSKSGKRTDRKDTEDGGVTYANERGTSAEEQT